MLKSFSLIVVIFLTLSVKAQVNSVDFEQLKGLQEINNKPVMIFIQTDWCNYCSLMKKILKNDQQIIDLLSKNFYVVMLNAEEKRTITFSGREFKYKPTGTNTGVHELARELGTVEGKLSYPALCFMNEKNEIIYQYAGFLESEIFLKTLQIIAKK
jgi:thioredoxin-related protein